MKKFTYENQGTNTYLVYHIFADETVDSLSLGMITNNSISGIAQTMCIQMDAEKYIKYNVSAKVSVSQFFSGVINKARLLGVFNGIVDALINSEEYMIDQNTLVFDLDYIFSDVSTCETVLICLPVMDVDKPQVDLGLFFKNIMFSSQFDQTENCDYVARIMNYLNSTPAFSFVDFKNVLKEIENTNTANIEVKQAVNPMTYEKEHKAQPVVSVDIGATQNVSQPVVSAMPVNDNSRAQELDSRMSEVLFETPVEDNIQENENKITENDKPMSRLYLMQHYTKENKAIYDAQQAAKKAGKNSSDKVTPTKAKEEKPMSKFYLMQHYTKENKAIYDAQQAAKKKDSKKSTVKSETLDERKSSVSFAVPGAPSESVNFAIPGQSIPEVSSVRNTVANTMQPAAAPVKEAVALTNQATAVQQRTSVNSNINIQANSVVGGRSASFGETVVLNAGMTGDTIVLNSSMVNNQVATPHLIRSKNGQKVYINKPIFRIGKEKSYVDFFIGDNSAISRSHANILTREDKYFVVDTNSTNHTYIDGNILQSNSEYEIFHGTKLRFANEDFEFKVY